MASPATPPTNDSSRVRTTSPPPGFGAVAMGTRRQRTADANGEVALYEKRRAIYQKEIDGFWARLRAGVLFALTAFYLALPWFLYGERQAVWLDVPARKFHFFQVTFWPQDFILLSWLLITGAFGLFFFTNLAGRLWCGFGCPQTVWTKFFMWIEWLVEGDRNARMKLDAQPMSARKLRLKLTKHAAWLVTCAVVGFTFVGYFIPIRDLIPRIFTGHVSSGETVFLAIASLALYFDAGFMREQICKYACPYARFQGAMFDSNTLTIFYDAIRGEPRGRRGRTVDHKAQGLGHCIDCNLCVQVCPTGIDIREGTQYECIGCTACIDACDDVMEKMNYPRGLIRYATEKSIRGGELRVLRPRLAGYGLLFTAMCSLVIWGFATRVPLELDVIRERGQLYRYAAGGQLENVYALKIINMDQADHEFSVRADGIEGLTMAGDATVRVASGEVATFPVRLRAPAEELARPSTPLSLTITATDGSGLSTSEETRFLAPPTR